jgi:hypothetical protein
MYTAKDFDRALLNPASVFKMPLDIVMTESLTAQQKLEVLKRWEADARLLEEATNENLSGGEPSRLGEVRRAIHELCDREKIPECLDRAA